MTENQSLQKYLLSNPWPDEYYGEKELNFYCRLNFNRNTDKIWHVISDTENINKMLGLGNITFHETDGRIHGSTKMMNFIHQWEELPWEWEFDREIKYSRKFSKGLARYSRSHFIIDKMDDGSTTLVIYKGIIPSGLAAFLLLKLYTKNFEEKICNIINTMMSDNQSPSSDKINNENASTHHLSVEKMEQSEKHLIENGIPENLAGKILDLISTGGDEEIARIKPVILAEKFHTTTEQALKALLLLTENDLLSLSWDIRCPYCRTVKEEHEELSSIKTESECSICRFTFSTVGRNIIEPTFRINRDIHIPVPARYCSAEVSVKSHIIFQKRIQHGKQYIFNVPDMINKRLRLRTGSGKSFGMIDIKPDNSTRNLYWEDFGKDSIHNTPPGSNLYIHNSIAPFETFIIETDEFDKYALPPSMLFNFTPFRQLFPNEKPSQYAAIDAGILNIVLIGVTSDSTRTNKNQLKDDFTIFSKFLSGITDLSIQYNGAVIKNLGDTVLLAFSNPVNALKFSLKTLSGFNGNSEENQLSTSIAITRGPCLAVNRSSHFDYYGSCVDISLKLLNYTEAGEISFTGKFAEIKDVSDYLNRKNYSFKNMLSAVLAGFGTVDYWKMRVKRLSR